MTTTSLFLVSFEIGVPSLDAGHDELLALIDELADFPREALGSSQFAVWQRGFADLVAAHFDDEEAWMNGRGLPAQQLCDHVAEHQRLIAQARSIGTAFPAGGDKTVRDLHRLLRFEFFKHYVQCDAKLKDFIGKDGKRPEVGQADNVVLAGHP